MLNLSVNQGYDSGYGDSEPALDAGAVQGDEREPESGVAPAERR